MQQKKGADQHLFLLSMEVLFPVPESLDFLSKIVDAMVVGNYLFEHRNPFLQCLHFVISFFHRLFHHLLEHGWYMYITLFVPASICEWTSDAVVSPYPGNTHPGEEKSDWYQIRGVKHRPVPQKVIIDLQATLQWLINCSSHANPERKYKLLKPRRKILSSKKIASNRLGQDRPASGEIDHLGIIRNS